MRLAALAAWLCVTSSIAHADDKAEAMVLFEQGIKDMEAGKTDLACRELAASLQKYPDSGTKGALAECYTQLGRIASAWSLWKELADTAPTDDLKADAANNARTLTPRLPRFKLTLAGPVVPGLAVTVNGSPADPQLSVELPVDPGPIAVIANAPKHDEWTSTFTAFEGRVTEIEIPALRATPEPPAAQQPTAPATGALRIDDATYAQLSATRRRRRVIGATLAITGLVGLGAGTAFGLSATSSWSKAKDACMDVLDPCRGDLAAANDYTDDARLSARLSTGFFVLGTAALIAGGVFWMTAPDLDVRTAQVTPLVGPEVVGISLSGSLR